ncbi:MAG: DUF2177 family protein [Bdellovibrionaceae bacterium]|nr:DUF2177 family protein [Pseudobdellovibrionaceae bacterium]
MNQLKLFASIFVVGIIIDFIWIGLIAKNFYISQIGSHMRFKADGTLDVLLWAALLVYVLVTVGIMYFVLPRLGADTSILQTFLWGALFGLIGYGIYDLTNIATMKDYPIAYVLTDTAWGTFLCGVLTVFASWAKNFFE